jgi:hypothetical protein
MNRDGKLRDIFSMIYVSFTSAHVGTLKTGYPAYKL